MIAVFSAQGTSVREPPHLSKHAADLLVLYILNKTAIMQTKDYVHHTDARGETGQAAWLSISSAEYIRGS
jgi:hypothetical protein